uniref:Cysteine-rich membrane protein 2 n=1 Tax=Spironucleus salmonicida TaxID=348837 RepID=V6LMH1_9EUKA|eukprot:EST45413.1 Hypothetical protein SS50377_14645 [Spironucleus salmonicida]
MHAVRCWILSFTQQLRLPSRVSRPVLSLETPKSVRNAILLICQRQITPARVTVPTFPTVPSAIFLHATAPHANRASLQQMECACSVAHFRFQYRETPVSRAPARPFPTARYARTTAALHAPAVFQLRTVSRAAPVTPGTACFVTMWIQLFVEIVSLGKLARAVFAAHRWYRTAYWAQIPSALNAELEASCSAACASVSVAKTAQAADEHSNCQKCLFGFEMTLIGCQPLQCHASNCNLCYADGRCRICGPKFTNRGGGCHAEQHTITNTEFVFLALTAVWVAYIVFLSMKHHRAQRQQRAERIQNHTFQLSNKLANTSFGWG